ncbi:hypothetical protein [Flavobacterium cerinum]|uniref:Dienelactone hydrolase domain-containing protein n=1 Tax=Flavobacterium cerinum TaxID=2502784 RepID=A0ABY5ITC6_9FLAO|nr:hypothetical protein [Flavobacterium cerinum]UUC44777.1 hypothetical protein NOX80_14210 [Flavobacterium cerinum]
MKFLKYLILFIPFASFSQSVDELIGQAQHAYSGKNYKMASENYQKAIALQDIGNYFVYYYAALTANLNKEEDLALKMLQQSVSKGLGQEDNEIDFIEKMPEFANLHDRSEWKSILSQMRNRNTEIKEKARKVTEDWKKSIYDNKAIKPGFTLLFQKIDTIDFPYLVYVPKSPKQKNKLPLIVYLHGGTGSQDFKELYENPEIQTEPIFTSARFLNAIVIYPIARESFSWYNNKKSLESIVQIVSGFESKFKYDKKNVILGGMSIGGRATFWFAEHQPKLFKGFYTFSGIPELDFEKLDFSKFDTTRPIISVNAKDDTTYKLDDVQKIYNQHKFDKWTLEVLEKGTHGFIYNSQVDGQEIVTETLKKLLD